MGQLQANGGPQAPLGGRLGSFHTLPPSIASFRTDPQRPTSPQTIPFPNSAIGSAAPSRLGSFRTQPDNALSSMGSRLGSFQTLPPSGSFDEYRQTDQHRNARPAHGANNRYDSFVVPTTDLLRAHEASQGQDPWWLAQGTDPRKLPAQRAARR